MSRTIRTQPVWRKNWFRHPKTSNEIRNNTGLIADIKVNDVPYDISGINRLHRHIPTAYDDQRISSKNIP